MSELSKQDKIVEMVKAGKYTRDAIIATAECTTKAFASYLTTMRNAAKFTGALLCPKEIEVDGKKVMSVDTFENVMAGREERKAAAKPGALDPKTPAERYALAVKRVERAKAALARMDAAIEANGKFSKNSEGDLRYKAAAIELQLADLLLANTAPVVEEEAPAPADIPAEDELV